jgi:predicted small lipoprotein YifL
MRRLASWTATVLVAALAGCGGGGSDEGIPEGAANAPALPTPETQIVKKGANKPAPGGNPLDPLGTTPTPGPKMPVMRP